MEPVKEEVPLAGLCTNFETKCSRTAKPYTKSTQFQIYWPTTHRGSKIKIGVLTLPELHVYPDNVNYAQVSEHWFWELPTRKLMHNDSVREHYYCYPHENEFDLPATFNMDLDMDEGTLRFRIGEQDLGVAFKNLKGKKLFLAFYTKGGNFDGAKVWELKFD